jgi:hypothetical protein
MGKKQMRSSEEARRGDMERFPVEQAAFLNRRWEEEGRWTRMETAMRAMHPDRPFARRLILGRKLAGQPTWAATVALAASPWQEPEVVDLVTQMVADHAVRGSLLEVVYDASGHRLLYPDTAPEVAH